MLIAVISDVHGNLAALNAVMDEISSLTPDHVVNLGDLVSGPFDPRGSAERQMTSGYLTIAGNHERQLVERVQGDLDDLARPLLSDEQLAWIAHLPQTLTLDDGRVFACHGSPAGGDMDYLLEDVRSGKAVLDDSESILPKLDGIGGAQVVLCGHTHTQRIAKIGGTLVVNPGSVGMPGYRVDQILPHVIEAGSPLARFAIIERRNGDWSAQLHAIPYHTEIPARQAEAFGFPDIAHCVRTGRVQAD
ncbi:phosphoesterase, MJ0936 family [Devosia sp. YR412]|uniref:metallophosphoesterase family protein n=1 Tax=Devosia sp. YR412 TaxID=1881030 RepID=UPI0008D84812|nr:metallophosphoesterase family protein [Devosia sp. YR412]SEP81172.1 phosphoesterase, MJ0936 family [Devosia sp. YR412]